MNKKSHQFIIWKIICVNKGENNICKKQAITSNNIINSLDREDLGIFDKILMLDTSKLLPKQRIMVEIALRRKELMDDSSFFISLRHLFSDYSDNYSLSSEKIISIFIPQYHEDENDNPLSEIEFVQSISGIRHLIQLHDGKYIQDFVFPNNGDDTNIPELTEIEAKDFIFAEKDIWCLNTFVYDSFRLAKSPLFRAPHPYKLELKNKRSYLVMGITDEQFVSSLIEFRKLYMENEPCNFLKTIKKMTDKRYIHHPIYKDFNKFREEYNYYLGKISLISTLKPLLQMIRITVDNLSDQVTGRNIINSLLYTGLIHQGEKEEHELRAALENELKSSEVVKFIFCCLISHISYIFQNSAVFIYNILRCINKLKITIPHASLSDSERRFNVFVLMKTYDLSEIIWKENGYSHKGIMQYHNNAQKAIEATFGMKFNLEDEN